MAKSAMMTFGEAMTTTTGMTRQASIGSIIRGGQSMNDEPQNNIPKHYYHYRSKRPYGRSAKVAASLDTIIDALAVSVKYRTTFDDSFRSWWETILVDEEGVSGGDLH